MQKRPLIYTMHSWRSGSYTTSSLDFYESLNTRSMYTAQKSRAYETCPTPPELKVMDNLVSHMSSISGLSPGVSITDKSVRKWVNGAD